MNYGHGLVHLVFTLILYLGLPLAGWGLGDWAGFFAHPARLIFALMIALSAALAAYQGMVIPEGQDRKDKRVGRQAVFLVTLEILFAALLFWLGYADRRDLAVLPDRSLLRFAGLALAAAGGAVIFGSRLTLGRLYSPQITLQTEHRLVTCGWYRFVRHPMYVGLLALLLGYALVFRSGVGLVCILILLFALVWRIGDEEALLRQEFGVEWEAYTRRSWRLLPGIW